jgi:hypothetical protein
MSQLPTLALIDASALRTLLEEIVSDQRAANETTKPILLDRAALARELSCSPSQIDKLRGQGMPTIWVGDSAPRFELAPCLEWLRHRKPASSAGRQSER